MGSVEERWMNSYRGGSREGMSTFGGVGTCDAQARLEAGRLGFEQRGRQQEQT